MVQKQNNRIYRGEQIGTYTNCNHVIMYTNYLTVFLSSVDFLSMKCPYKNTRMK